MRRTWIPGFLSAISIALLAVACSREPVSASASAVAADSPQAFSEVGPFELVERSGDKVTREDLLGRPWVASFLYTRCTGPCPSVRGTLKELQTKLGDSGARIVTFSVDPEWDRPEVLRAYAETAGAHPKRWLFLTGEPESVRALIRQSFLSPVERSADAPIGEQVTHRTQLVAVDKKGRVRGFYHGESDDQLDLLLARLAFLEREGP